MDSKVYFQFNIVSTFKLSCKQRNSVDTGDWCGTAAHEMCKSLVTLSQTSIFYMIVSHMDRKIIKCESSKNSQPMKAWLQWGVLNNEIIYTNSEKDGKHSVTILGDHIIE